MNDEKQARLQKVLDEALKPVLKKLDIIEDKLNELKHCGDSRQKEESK